MFKKIIAIVAILFPFSTQAASLYLDPASGRFGPGDTFGVKIRLNVEKGECVNAAEIRLAFPKESLAVEDFSTGDSVLNLWIEKPERLGMAEINASGMLSFSGGVPGGYCGKVPGDPGDSNIIGEIFFKVPDGALDGTDGWVGFSDGTKLLLNDGFGTEAVLALQGGEYSFSSEPGQVQEWADKIRNDKTQPETFTVELNRDDSVFGGGFFIMFSTTDKQTGVDHYEVMETRISDLNKSKTWLDLFRRKNPALWKQASSPYLLDDQSLQSQIKVKAIDKAGNERTIEFIPSDRERFSIAGGRQDRPDLNIYAIAGIIIVLLAVIVLIVRRKKTQ